MSLVVANLNLLRIKNKKKKGTQVPGPFEIKWVVFNKWFLINWIELRVDLRVVNIAVI